MNDRTQLIVKTKDILREFAIQPKKSFGQNFCVEPALLELILSTCKEINPDAILEIGGGLGTLSERLLELEKPFTIVEKDDALAFLLEKKFKDDNVSIINQDVLDLEDKEFYEFDLIIGNIPYEISSPLLFKIWKLAKNLKKKPDIIFTVQKEFALRLSANYGTQNYGRLTAMAHIHSNPKVLKIYPPSSFYPVPKIAHGVIWLRPINNVEEFAYSKSFSNFMISLFNRKNKRAVNSLEPSFKKENKKEISKILRGNALFNKRVKDLTPEECLIMFKSWNELNN